MATISRLYIYPVKSLGGVSLQQSKVTRYGLEHDRRWMLIDAQNRFMTQLQYPAMSQFAVQISDGGLHVTHLANQQVFTIPYQPQTNSTVQVQVWDDDCTGTFVSAQADAWFSKQLDMPCRLVYMTDDSIRTVNQKYADPQHITSFTDGYPTLMISEASVRDLNTRLQYPVEVIRFRPNVVIDDVEPYFEDRLREFRIGDIQFRGVKPCPRCIMINLNPQTAQTHPEPLKVLAGYRKQDNRIMMGQNLVHNGLGIIKVGNTLVVDELSEPLEFSNAQINLLQSS
jgi:uncharacterized protein